MDASWCEKWGSENGNGKELERERERETREKGEWVGENFSLRKRLIGLDPRERIF